MYSIKSDLTKNILYITLEGFLSDEIVKTAADLTINEINKLKPGFSIINDISSFKPATAKGAEEIKRAQVYASAKGVSRIIRVVKQSHLGAMQFSRTAKDAGYDNEIASSVEEAERMLNG